jgi:hypothetical protein
VLGQQALLPMKQSSFAMTRKIGRQPLAILAEFAYRFILARTSGSSLLSI